MAADLLYGLATNRQALVLLVATIALLATTLVLLPALAVSPSSTPASRNVATRLLYQLRLLLSGSTPLRERARSMLLRDGRSDGEIILDSDFFILVRLTLGIALALIALLFAIAFETPGALGIAVIGYVGPSFVALRYNASRRKRMIEEMPRVMRALETRIGSGMSIDKAFRRLSERRSGPIYSELAWAAGQMSIPSINQFEVIRMLDERSNFTFWAPLADQLERASKRGKHEVTETFLAYITRVLEEDDARRGVAIAALGNKVLIGMLPFLMVALLLSLAGPLIISSISGGGAGGIL